jgi:hypothetical protein
MADAHALGDALALVARVILTLHMVLGGGGAILLLATIAVLGLLLPRRPRPQGRRRRH